MKSKTIACIQLREHNKTCSNKIEINNVWAKPKNQTDLYSLFKAENNNSNNILFK